MEVIKSPDSVARVLLDLAQRSVIDIIAMTTRGLNTLSQLPLGRDATEVLEHSSVPVLLVPSQPGMHATDHTGQRGRSAVAERPPGLILLDMRMPAMDGETFVRAFRAMPNATAPIVVFSALPNVEEHAARLGAVGWITKPFDLGDLISTVNRALRLRATAA